MNREWYYQTGDIAAGPVSTGDIAALYRTGAIKDHTYIYAEEIAEWTPASNLMDEIVAASSEAVDANFVSVTIEGDEALWYFFNGEQHIGPCNSPQIFKFAESGAIQRDTLIYKIGQKGWGPFNNEDWAFIQNEISDPPINESEIQKEAFELSKYWEKNRLFCDFMYVGILSWALIILDYTSAYHGINRYDKIVNQFTFAMLIAGAFYMSPYNKWYKNALRGVYMLIVYLGLNVIPTLI